MQQFKQLRIPREMPAVYERDNERRREVEVVLAEGADVQVLCQGLNTITIKLKGAQRPLAAPCYGADRRQ